MVPARTALVALNQCLDVSRSVVCRLGEEIEAFLRRLDEPDETLASRFQVPSGAFGLVRQVLAGAPTTAAREERLAAELGLELSTRLDPSYPAPLLELPQPPPVLYLRGSLPTGVGVGIVGARRATAYGREVGDLFGRELAAGGAIVVSGFARGVDAAAHRGAAAAGHTIAVLGCGVDVPYPRGHEKLAELVAANGAVLSEFPLGTPPRPFNFPIRNRIIAALSRAVIVVEASVRSGSLVTARLALELGRDVLAVPGSLFEELSLGPNGLLRSGAAPALHPDDVLEMIGLSGQPRLPLAAAPPPPPGAAGCLWSQLGARPRTAEDLAAELDWPLDRVLAVLLDLELSCRVERCPGPAYRPR